MTNSYKSRNIYCEGFMPKNKVIPDKTDLHLSLFDFYNNIKSDFGELGRIIKNKDELAFDLIRIATYVYIADSKTQRGGDRNAYDEHWNINLNFYVPVFQPNFWGRDDVKNLLSETLHFAVGHQYNFTFTKWNDNDKQQFLDLEMFSEAYTNLDIDCISLFSGGLDSLYSTILLLEEKRKPLLLSHHSIWKLSKYRDNLKTLLNDEYNTNLHKLEVKLTNHKSKIDDNKPKEKEYTQRSRSVVYACLGSAYAKCLNVQDVYLSDNGIVTFNLPHSAQNVGTLNTRSTNPKLISYVNRLNKLIWKEDPPQIENKLLWFTKADVIKGLKDLNKSKLLPYSTSCASTRNTSNANPFCGICSQCVDRRFAVDWVQISNDDEPREHYKENIFTDNLYKDDAANTRIKNIGKTHAENYYRKAEEIHKIKDTSDFWIKYPMVSDFMPDGEELENFIQQTFNLHKRFARQSHEVIQSYWTDYKAGKFHENSLVSMAFRESKVPATINDYVIPPKQVILNIRKRAFYFKTILIDLTKFEFDFLLMLSKEPDATIAYDELMKEDFDRLKGNSTPAYTHRKNINNKIKRACQNNNIEISNKFSLIKTIKDCGYRISDKFINEIEIQNN